MERSVRVHWKDSGPIHAYDGPIPSMSHLLESDRAGHRKNVQNDDDEQGPNVSGYYHTVTLGPWRIPEAFPIQQLLKELTESGHQYVLVGGYAVSAFNARFSTDLDIVVVPDSKEEFVAFLETHGFEETDSHAKQWFYDPEVIEYGKTTRAPATDRLRFTGERPRLSPDRGAVVVRVSA
jgi:radical SAM superfamily enzyme YgiQ (UPF0313 family)